jgi:hypothetical protein
LKLSKVESALSLSPPFLEVQNSLIPSSTLVKGSNQWYNLDNLKDGYNYGIRISYPAIVRELVTWILYDDLLTRYFSFYPDTCRFPAQDNQ